jgi:CRISPR-associated protein Csb1
MSEPSLVQALLRACGRDSDVAAIRLTTRYEPIGGPTSKVFPPTYPDRGYITEARYIEGVERAAVVLDSVPSQANRLEEALLDAVEDDALPLPYIEVAPPLEAGSFRVTSLDAPHRSPDAYFRDAETGDGVAFDRSPLGQRLRSADERSARAYFEHSPTDLLLGIWDSQRGGRGLRLARAYTSEIVALDPKRGERSAGRLDPYNMQGGELFYDKEDPSSWSFDAKALGSAKATKGKPSNVNHGNALAKDPPGGFAVTDITRTAVLSLGVLQRLRFPDDSGTRSADVDAAGRAVLAALAVLGDRLAFAKSGLFLRSGCDLVSTGERVEWVKARGITEAFDVTVADARRLFDECVAHAASLGLAFASDVVRLRPAANLRELIELNLSRPAAVAET